ncbi:unnamed protein product [Urochloa humidicola]
MKDEWRRREMIQRTATACSSLVGDDNPSGDRGNLFKLSRIGHADAHRCLHFPRLEHGDVRKQIVEPSSPELDAKTWRAQLTTWCRCFE